ncbi:hypothetical protein AAMO2058_001361100 [Amorphochlora amoebiformis]
MADSVRPTPMEEKQWKDDVANPEKFRSCSQASTARFWINLKFSCGYLVSSVILCLLCMVVMIWELSGQDIHHWIPMVCEGVINTILVIDVSFDVVSQGWEKYSSQIVNWIDMGVTITCIGLFIALIVRHESSGVYDSQLSQFDVTFLSIRYVFMVFRIWVVVSKMKRGADMRAQGEVDFEKMDDEDDVQEPLFSTKNSTPRDRDIMAASPPSPL